MDFKCFKQCIWSTDRTFGYIRNLPLIIYTNCTLISQPSTCNQLILEINACKNVLIQQLGNLHCVLVLILEQIKQVLVFAKNCQHMEDEPFSNSFPLKVAEHYSVKNKEKYILNLFYINKNFIKSKRLEPYQWKRIMHTGLIHYFLVVLNNMVCSPSLLTFQSKVELKKMAHK